MTRTLAAQPDANPPHAPESPPARGFLKSAYPDLLLGWAYEPDAMDYVVEGLYWLTLPMWAPLWVAGWIAGLPRAAARAWKRRAP